jgi:ABC-2 type transport system ATP-binding protein
VEAIRCQALTRTYGQVRAVDGLSLSVAAGSIFGFLGRNGAGKTTTIRLLTGLARPTAGEAWVAGVQTTDGREETKAVFGYLPEEPAFYTWMTPREYLQYVGRLYGLTQAQAGERSRALLDLTGLQAAGGRRIAGFSRGMRQRLGLAQALIHRPPVLFLDEPTSALDPAGRHEVLNLIGSLRGQTTVFLSSHILADVERVCDRVGVIHQGRLQLLSGSRELLEQFPSNVARMTFDPVSLPVPVDFRATLGRQEWTASVAEEPDGLLLTANDLPAAKRNLPRLIADHGLLLDRLEWSRPTLEEVFLNVSSDGSPPQG